jgi:hypothetical protein
MQSLPKYPPGRSINCRSGPCPLKILVAGMARSYICKIMNAHFSAI